MYLCALALTTTDDPEFFIAGSFFDDRFGISRSSRKRGRAELVERGVLTYTVESYNDLLTHRRVRRNIYRVAKRFQQPEAWAAPEAAVEDKTKAGKVARLRFRVRLAGAQQRAVPPFGTTARHSGGT